MGRIIHISTVDSVQYGVGAESGDYYRLEPKKLKWLLWLCGPSSGYLLYLVTRRQAEAFSRWYFLVATPGLNVWVLVVTVVFAAVAGYGIGWLVLLRLRKRYVPVVLERGLEVTVMRQARREVNKFLAMALPFILFSAMGCVLLFYWTSYFPSVVIIWLCAGFMFFLIPVCGVARFKVVWGRWRELKREGLV